MINKNQISEKFIPKSKPIILIIDDDYIIRNSMKCMMWRVFSKLEIEYEVIEGSSGIELVDLVNDDIENNIKLIFTDEDMPGCEGSEAISMICHIKQRNDIKIISITAIDDLTMIKKILNCGADEVIAKPIHIMTLERIIVNYMS